MKCGIDLAEADEEESWCRSQYLRGQRLFTDRKRKPVESYLVNSNIELFSSHKPSNYLVR